MSPSKLRFAIRTVHLGPANQSRLLFVRRLWAPLEKIFLQIPGFRPIWISWSEFLSLKLFNSKLFESSPVLVWNWLGKNLVHSPLPDFQLTAWPFFFSQSRFQSNWPAWQSTAWILDENFVIFDLDDAASTPEPRDRAVLFHEEVQLTSTWSA